MRAKQAAERDRARRGMLAGDERYFPARDKGPARKFARDWVDSRRLPSQYFLPFSLLILLATWVPWPPAIRVQVLNGVIVFGWPVMMVGVLFTSIYVAWKIKKQVAAKMPRGEPQGRGLLRRDARPADPQAALPAAFGAAGRQAGAPEEVGREAVTGRATARRCVRRVPAH